MSRRFSIFAVLLLLAAPALFAQSNGAPAIHIFGGWAYGRTNGNEYLAGTRQGAFDNLTLALNLAATPVEPLRLEAQFSADIDRGDRETAFDFAFAEWRFSDALRVRAGKMKHPFGIYTEIYDVGTLRPFYSLPQSVYGPTGTFAKAYNGVGVSGFRKLGTRWAVTYDVYAGELDLPIADLSQDVFKTSKNGELGVKNVIGGRAVFETPIDGLSFGASAYRGTIDAAETRVHHRAAGAQIEYVNDRLSLRTEWTDNATGASGEHAGYVEAAWRFTPRWQVAGRLDGVQENRDRTTDGRHNEASIGVNYWFTRQFVVKLSGHHIDGTHFAQPDAVTGRLENQTHLLMFGAQFSF
jgi:hypothetical protein